MASCRTPGVRQLQHALSSAVSLSCRTQPASTAWSVDAYRIGRDVDRGFGFRLKPRQICFGRGETGSLGICWETARHAAQRRSALAAHKPPTPLSATWFPHDVSATSAPLPSSPLLHRSHAAPFDHGISSQPIFHHLMHSIIHRITFQDEIKERDLRPFAVAGPSRDQTMSARRNRPFGAELQRNLKDQLSARVVEEGIWVSIASAVSSMHDQVDASLQR
jgi:hypothetical protein